MADIKTELFVLVKCTFNWGVRYIHDSHTCEKCTGPRNPRGTEKKINGTTEELRPRYQRGVVSCNVRTKETITDGLGRRISA